MAAEMDPKRIPEGEMEVKVENIDKLGDKVVLHLSVIHEGKVEKLHFVYESAVE